MSAYWLNEDSRKFLSKGYLAPGQSAEERIRVIAETAERYLQENYRKNVHQNTWEPLEDSDITMPKELVGYADKLEQYLLNGWISLASPVWSNFGTNAGLPISCNNSHFSDNMASILLKTAEIGMMTKLGAGTSAYVGELRERGSTIKSGGKSDGPVRFMELIQSHINTVSQAQVRRGNAAVYIDIEHADAEEFLDCREEGHPIQHLSLGLNVTDTFLQKVIDRDRAATKLWLKVLKKRAETGYPYLFFIDTVNRNAPIVYRDKGIKIKGSNLCIEIALASTEFWSFVCCLSSLNLLHYEAWKDTDLVETMTMFLDSVMEEYIQKIEKMSADEQYLMKSAYRFAKEQRAIGLGVLGYHSLLQSKMIAFKSEEARALNIEAHKLIDEKSLAASKWMAVNLGEPDLLKGYGERNVTRLAIAPTTSSSFILGQVSPSIEPFDSNYFTSDLQKGKFSFKNPYLEALLISKGKNDLATWKSILVRGGSVQHLTFLTDHERDVFKTFGEIDQMEIIIQAADRQPYIDQSQSLNVKIHPDTPLKDVNALIIEAWKLGVKSLYYQRSTNPVQEFARELISCSACEA